jgi:hypothetical protein
MAAENYDAIELYPHFPHLPRTLYMHPPLPTSGGSSLNTFIEFFSPASLDDHRLLKVFLAALIWGGAPGSRPAWLFTGPTGDALGGRGVGKSILVELAAELVGGFIDARKNEDMPSIIKRLLSPGARHLRVVRLDNVKSDRFSWADLEGLITAPVISGHQMYEGEGRRPNTVTWAITVNGATLSRDMAQRCIIVTLARPHPNPGWADHVRQFVAVHRWQIIRDLQVLLESDQ